MSKKTDTAGKVTTFKVVEKERRKNLTETFEEVLKRWAKDGTEDFGEVILGLAVTYTTTGMKVFNLAETGSVMDSLGLLELGKQTLLDTYYYSSDTED